MNTALQQIEQAITQLSPDHLQEFREWYEGFDAQMWGSQMEDDLKSGRLDGLAASAITDHQKGLSKRL